MLNLKCNSLKIKMTVTFKFVTLLHFMYLLEDIQKFTKEVICLVTLVRELIEKLNCIIENDSSSDGENEFQGRK